MHAQPTRVLLLSAFCLLLSGTARADTIEMKDTGLKLEGKVHREMDDVIIFELKDVGKVRILKSQIKSIEYDIGTLSEYERAVEDMLAHPEAFLP